MSTTTLEKPIHITDASFDETIDAGDRPVLVDFWADWCAPCKTMEPMLEEISNLLSGRIHFVKVNEDSARQIAVRYHIQSVPTLLDFNK